MWFPTLSAGVCECWDAPFAVGGGYLEKKKEKRKGKREKWGGGNSTRGCLNYSKTQTSLLFSLSFTITVVVIIRIKVQITPAPILLTKEQIS